MTTQAKQCADCRNGEHDNYDDDVIITVVKDPDTGKLVKRSYMCGCHRDMYASDGYALYYAAIGSRRTVKEKASQWKRHAGI
jgi:hypothetical protein